MALWHETIGKTPKELLSAIDDKPLIQVDEDKALRLAREKLKTCGCLAACALFDKEGDYMNVAGQISRKYGIGIDKISNISFENLQQEISPREFDSMLESITGRLQRFIGGTVTYREQILHEIQSVYGRSLLGSCIFSPDTDQLDLIMHKYYQGKGTPFYDNADGGVRLEKRHFDYDAFIFDLLVLDKLFGAPLPDDLANFLGDNRCWYNLKKEVKTVFSARWGLG